MADVPGDPCRPPEGLQVHQRQHFAENLDAAAECLFQELPFCRNQLVLFDSRCQGPRQGFRRTGLCQKSKYISFVYRFDSRLHVCITREQHAHAVGGNLPCTGKELNPVHPGHAEVRDDDSVWPLVSD